jgi:hypothetical protein
MPKLDVGVGDEFPAREVKDEPAKPAKEEEPAVHHHHYYRGRYRDYRRRGRWLWFVLWVLVITALFRSFDMMMGAAGWMWGRWGWPWSAWGSWVWGPFHALQGTLMAILIIAGLIWMANWRQRDEERRDDEDHR